MEEVKELSEVDWERVYAIACYTKDNKFRFKVCYSDQEVEKCKIDLLFDDSVDPYSIRFRGLVQK